jgi:predicted CopG family antitoxin
MEKSVVKQNLTIKISLNTYHQLKSDIGKGKMSDFIERLITKELGGTEKKIEQEYRECYANPRMLKEAGRWEKTEIKSWLNYERNKRVNRK